MCTVIDAIADEDVRGLVRVYVFVYQACSLWKDG